MWSASPMPTAQEKYRFVILLAGMGHSQAGWCSSGESAHSGLLQRVRHHPGFGASFEQPPWQTAEYYERSKHDVHRFSY